MSTQTKLAPCGIDCAQCKAYLAWKSDDQALRISTAAEWSAMHSADIRPEHINCAGCKATEGPKFHYCTQCDVRSCAASKSHVHCGLCADATACANLKPFLEGVPGAKERLFGAV